MEKILIVDFGSQYTRLIAKKIRQFEVYSEVISPEEFNEICGLFFNNNYDLNDVFDLYYKKRNNLENSENNQNKYKNLKNKIIKKRYEYTKINNKSDTNIKKNEKANKDNKTNDKLEKNIDKIKGIILSGGPGSVNEEKYPEIERFLKYISDSNSNFLTPLLGICYGMQLIANSLSGKVKKGKIAEYGSTIIKIKEDRLENNQSIFHNILNTGETTLNVWMSHGDSVEKVPQRFNISAVSDNGIIAGFENTDKKIYALQFHPEVHHTKNGDKIISNFIFNICKCGKQWNLKSIVDIEIKKMRETIGNNKAIIGLSGGVDSSVAAVLAYKAIGKNLNVVFVDHGLLRYDEVNEVKKIFTKLLDIDLTIVDAKSTFFKALKNIVDPEQKRKIIGEKFIRVFEEVAKKDNDVKYLIQGTIYSDIIESAASGKKTVKIKSHHNVGGLPEHLKLKIVEPLKSLFKDEVRNIGKYLGIPDSILKRHPFPGPGLAIRIIGEVTEEKVKILQLADKIFIDELKNTGWYDKIWQAFVVLTSVKSVGVVGDNRKYGYVAALRAVNSTEGMTANWSKIPYEILEKISNKITNTIPEIGRVVYDISSKPPATIEWE